MRLFLTSLALALLAATSPAAIDRARYEPLLRQADAAFAGSDTQVRLEAMAAVHRATLDLGDPSRPKDETPAWWFAELRSRASNATVPEVAYFLQTEVRLDPAGASFEMLDPKPVARVPYQPGIGLAAQLADTARSLEMGEAPRMTADQLRAVATNGRHEESLARRALVLLRRMDPASAAPLLWARLNAAKQRSEVFFWEEQLLRVPVQQVGKFAYDAKASPAARAAWLRIAAVRPSLPVATPDRAGWIALLKGPANEVTEAAWDAAPRVFRAADRAELAALAAAAPERLAPRAKAAVERLR